MNLYQRNSENYQHRNNRSYNMVNRQQLTGNVIEKNASLKSKTVYNDGLQNQYSTASDIQTEIRTYLKALVQQKHPIKKLMISSILATLYIEQHNYQQAHQILTNIQTTMEKLQAYSLQNKQQNSIFSRQDFLDLAVIAIKMFANFILIAIINVQVQLFEKYLNQAIEFIGDFLNGHKRFFNEKQKHNLIQKYSSQNSNPNIQDLEELSRQQSIQFSIVLFKLLLKSFSGYESFQQIQAETLIAQCQTKNYSCNEIDSFFYFSNISFLKLLSTSDYQSAYKLQVYAYDFIESEVEKSQHEINLKQVILKTVSLKKLLFLAEELKLPSQIIRMYKQKLYSSEALQSQYLEGLQQNTIFRNYNEKINLGFQLISQLKQFQKEYISPIEFDTNSRARKSNLTISNLHDQLELWQCKALKNRFIQLMATKSLDSNSKVKQNISLLVDTLNMIIKRHSFEGKQKDNEISVEQTLLLQNLGCLRQKSVFSQKDKKSQSMTLYESATLEYKHRLQIFCYAMNQKLIKPLYERVFQKLQQNQQQQPQISVEVYEDKQSIKQQQSEQDSQPSIYLQDVQFEVIGNKQKNQNRIFVGDKKKTQTVKFVQAQQIKKHQPYQQKINKPKNQQHQIYRKNEIKPYSKSPQQAKHDSMYISKSPRKNIFLNEKNQVYVNYAEIGSRVKLNHLKPAVKEQFQQKFQNRQNIYKKSIKQPVKDKYYQESIKKQQGQIQIPNQQSIVRLVDKKYPFQGKQNDRFSPLSLISEKKPIKTDSIFEKFKHEHKVNIDSKIIEQIQEQKSIQQRSVSKSRRKVSSISPRVPKDSTINSRLNQHIKKHQLTYSPQSRPSGIKSKKFEKQDKQEQLSSYSVNLSPSQKSRSKHKAKVQKASSYLKSPNNAGSNLHNKTIKFREYMDNLQKSGVNINEVDKSQKNIPKPKVESKISHRRIVTEANQNTQQNYQSYISGMTSKLKSNQGNSGILQGFLSQPAQQAYKSMVKNQPLNDFHSTDKQKDKQQKKKQIFLNPKRTGSQLVYLQQQNQISKNKYVQNQRQIKGTQGTIKEKEQIQQIKSTKSQLKSIQPLQNILSSQVSGILSPEMISNYVMKMIKSHKAKLNHSIKLCQNGQYVDKKHYSSDGGDERFLQLSSDHKNLQWAVSQSKLLQGHKTKYQIKNIKGVVYGQVTETMRKGANKNLQSFKCISFIFQKRTFDIYVTEEQDLKFWLPGISFCVSQSRPQLNHPNYTTKIQKFIKKRDYPLKKDDLHSNSVYYSLGRVLWKRMLLKMQLKFLVKSKKLPIYKNANAGAIIQFKKSLVDKQKQSRIASMLPPTGKNSKMSKEKSLSQHSKVNQR